MELILTVPVKKLGKIGDKVTVRPGFGRNYLLPQKMALRATAENLQIFEERRKEIELENKKLIDESIKIQKKIENKDFTFIKQAGADGKLFGSVSNKEIAEAVSKLIAQELNATQIVINHPIKTIGVYSIVVQLHSEVHANILVNVAKSESEAQEALKQLKAESKKSEEQSTNIENQTDTKAASE